ncbi:MAG: agmatine deiminase family protein [Myxococcota bacterium]|nr:agmatine deiminase family protein [Myxococcota bacterium]
MLRNFLLIPALLLVAACSNNSSTTSADTPSRLTEAKPMLPAHPLPGERGSGKADQYDDFKNGNPATYGITTAPQTPMRAVAQWDQHQSLLLTWTNNFPTTYASIVAAAKPVVDIYIVHQGQQSKTQFQNAMAQNGVSTAGLNYLNLQNNSIWMRDYGPLSVRTPAGEVAFVDPRYYHTRVYDDALPTLVGNNFGVNVYRQPLNWEGGTFIADGQGNCYYSQGVFWYGGASESQLQTYQRDYLGCETNVVLKPLANEGTTHTDMFAKLTSKNNMILGEYKSWQDSVNKQVLDDNEAILQNAILNDGSSLQVTRLPMPNNNNQTVWRTYANSLFVNGVNLVPVYSDETTYETEALQVWQSTLPTWNHIPVDSTSLITWSGAVHCITMTVPSGQLTAAESAPDFLCNGSFSCTPNNTGAGSCSLPFEGCCDGDSVQLCGDNGVQTTSCGSSGCGYTTDTMAYGCGGTGNAPSNAPLACGVSCEPSCGTNVCGPDGCGGVCGTCSSGQICNGGQCTDTPDPCDGISFEGCCSGSQLKYCDENQVQTISCTSSCGWNAGAEWYDCGFSGADPSGDNPLSCDAACVPNCTNAICGDDGCGGSCGTCDSGQSCNAGQCVCVPACDGKVCGSDGCGGSCGDCTDGTSCNAVGQCVGQCVPACEGKACGADGCGGSCGTCAPEQSCNATGQCEAPTGCGEVTYEGFCTGSVLTWCNEDNDELQTYDCSQLGDVTCAAIPGSDPPSYDCIQGATCTPACDGKVCGSDGCGGSCGVCGDGATCEAGQCITAEDSCGGLTFQGCCDDTILTWCENSEIQTLNCQNTGCGWNSAGSYYDCNQTADGPPEFPKACGDDACEPNCDGKICGSDGCGGSCGVCTGGETCEAGQCVDPCGGVPYEGQCTGTALTYCESSELISGDCSAQNACCGWDADNAFYTCVPCGTCQDECETGSNGCSALGTHAWICNNAGECNTRTYTECTNGCDTATGACSATTCEPSCDSKECGDDGCGGSCGSCAAGSSCNASGVCVEACSPSCDGKNCGDDGCGGSCGTCSAGESCVEGQCAPTACEPKCEGKVCGNDGCGGSCGTCPAGKLCDKFGACIDEPICEPSCTDKVCGDDGCGGTCGVCGKEEECANGACIPSATAGCGGVPADGACDGDKLTFCDESGTVSEINCAAQGLTCGASGTGFDCIDPNGCIPACAGKTCGDDGCGGSCGNCAKGDSCVSGQCISDDCVPSCDGKSCGGDGCGGSCGECSGGTECNASGACVAGNATDDGLSSNATNSVAGSDGGGCTTAGGNGRIPLGIPATLLAVLGLLAVRREVL